MGAVAIVAHQRTVRALRVVVLPARVAVVDQQGQPRPERVPDRAHPGVPLGGDLGHVTRREGRAEVRLDFGDGAAHRLRGRRTPAAGEPPPLRRHVELAELAVARGPPPDAVKRDGVQDLVRQDDPVDEGLGPALQPAHASGQGRRAACKGLCLALGELARDLEDEIAAGQAAEAGQGGEDLRGEGPGAGAELEHRGPRPRVQDLGGLAREAAAEEGGDLGGGNEITRASELRERAAVVAEPRRVEGQLQVAEEGDGPPGALDLLADEREQPPGVGPRLRSRVGQALGQHQREGRHGPRRGVRVPTERHGCARCRVTAVTTGDGENGSGDG